MKPRAALAMAPRLAGAAFTDAQRARLSDLVELADGPPLATFEGAHAAAVLAGTEVLIGHWGCPTVDAEALALAPNLRLLVYGAGSLKERATITRDVFERGVVVTSAAAGNAVPVAEYTLAAILLANKGAFLSREWLRDPERAHARRPNPVGNYRKRVGIVGASHVGRKVIELLKPFTLDVVVTDPYLDPDDPSALGVVPVGLDDLLSSSDVVSVHAPLLPSTVDMIGAAQLARMKDGAVLINTARGRLVVTEALTAELATGRLSAVLDVTWPEPLPPESPLLSLPNAFVTPHLAGSQGSELERLGDLVLEEIERFVRGDRPLHAVTESDLDRLA